MIQQSHFWLSIQRERNHYLEKISALPSSLGSITYNSWDIETTQYMITDEYIFKMFYVHTYITCSMFSYKKERNPFIYNSIDEPGGHGAKWDKLDTERQALHDCIYKWNFKNQTHRTESRMVGGAGYGDTGQKVQAFSYKMNKLWGSNVRHGDYS